MPRLDEIKYSRDACVDHYQFLIEMSLSKSVVFKPLTDGWPSIIAESMRDLGKTD